MHLPPELIAYQRGFLADLRRGREDDLGWTVYRRNVAFSMLYELERRHPLLCRLLGPANKKFLAAELVRRLPNGRDFHRTVRAILQTTDIENRAPHVFWVWRIDALQHRTRTAWARLRGRP